MHRSCSPRAVDTFGSHTHCLLSSKQVEHAISGCAAPLACARGVSQAALRYTMRHFWVRFSVSAKVLDCRCIDTDEDVACVSAVYLGYLSPGRLNSNLFDATPNAGKLARTCVVHIQQHALNCCASVAILIVWRLPNAVSDLHGRTFAMWTSMSCVLCLFCAKNPQNRAIYSKFHCCAVPLARSEHDMDAPHQCSQQDLVLTCWRTAQARPLRHLCWRCCSSRASCCYSKHSA